MVRLFFFFLLITFYKIVTIELLLAIQIILFKYMFQLLLKKVLHAISYRKVKQSTPNCLLMIKRIFFFFFFEKSALQSN